MPKLTLAIALLSIGLTVGCSKKTDSTMTDSSAVNVPPPAPMDTTAIGAKDSGMNSPTKPGGMTGILNDTAKKK